MPSTPTQRLRVERQELGSGLNVWGDTKLNEALERIDESIAGVQAITISGTSTTLTSTNYATDQARKAALVLTGTLSANSTITVPNVEKLYLVVNNATQGAYSLTIKTAAGSGYALRGGPQWVYCDATDVYRASGRLDQLPVAGADVALGGYKITGLGTPSAGADAATKAYADAGDTAITSTVAASATAAAGSATSASTSASNAATSATASATSATASATSASNSATSATAAANSATAAAGSATAAAASAASIAGGPVTSVNALTGAVVLGVANISGAAPLASPTFTGTPAAPTAAGGTNTTQLATTAYVRGEITSLINAAPGALDTLDELAAALGDDANYAATVTTALALKAPLASPTFTGTTLISGRIANGVTAVSGYSVDLSTGNYHYKTVVSTATFTFSNPPATGTAFSFVLEVTNGGAFTVNWPGSVVWPGGTAPTLTTSGTDLLTFITRDGGTTWRGVFMTTGNASLSAPNTFTAVNTFTKAVRGSIVALTDAATIAVDASLANYFSVTLGGNRTLGNPSNLVAGQGGSIIITQDGAGSRTLAYSSNWKFAGGAAPVLTTTAAAVDRLDYLVVSGSLIHAALVKDIK